MPARTHDRRTTGERQVLCQEGHAVEVYSIAFQRDSGALVATGDLGGVARVWDLRSGKSIFVMQGHTKGVLSLDWAPDGYKLASGGDDHTVRLWDMRAKVSARVGARACACVRACVRAYLCASACVLSCLRACVALQDGEGGVVVVVGGGGGLRSTARTPTKG
jgi:WD40 repeat protein